jgi:uncharacterized protein YkwD
MKVYGEWNAPMTTWQRRFVVVLATSAILSLVVAGAASASASAAESRLIALHNEQRASYGLSPLRSSSALNALARRYSQRMAAAGSVWHMASLGADVAGWLEIGDNVGMSNDLYRLMRGFMASPDHRDNILHATYTLIGVGIVAPGDGEYYVTVIFEASAPATRTAREARPHAPAPQRPAPDIAAVDIVVQLAGMDAGITS